MRRNLFLALATIFLTQTAFAKPDIGTEFGNGSFIQNFLGKFGFQLPSPVPHRNNGSTTEMKIPGTEIIATFLITADKAVKTADDLFAQTADLGWTRTENEQLGDFAAVERLTPGRFGTSRMELRVFLEKEQVASYNLDECSNCRAQKVYRFIKKTLVNLEYEN